VEQKHKRTSKGKQLAPVTQQLHQSALHDTLPDSVLFGKTAAMEVIRHKIEHLAGTNAPVLIQGEGGTGKQLLASPHVISPQLMELMQRYNWPGNIRELENLVRRYVILGSEQVIGSELLAKVSTDFPPEKPSGNISLRQLTRQAACELERRLILKSAQEPRVESQASGVESKHQLPCPATK
jgi:DNA-binding NtrC family response regulator